MALCTSCGSKVDDAASFCTSCGQRMPSSNGATATITVTRPICSVCGAQVDLGSVFCTNCGQRMAQPAVIEETAPAPSEAPPIAAATAPPLAVDAATVPPPLSVTTPEDAATQPAATPQIAPPVIAPPVYATPTDYSPAQPTGGAFRTVVLILLLVIVVGALGGWYFWGVETVIVCSPPDVRVFLDDKEVQPSSYGRYVVPHLSRQSHLLKVQRPGFADTIQKLDFPMTTAHEWVNVTLVSSKRLRR
jgi:hypothetical protein